MNNLFKSLVIFVFTTNIMGMHAHGGGHMKGNSTDWEIETYTTAAPDFIGDFATVVSKWRGSKRRDKRLDMFAVYSNA